VRSSREFSPSCVSTNK